MLLEMHAHTREHSACSHVSAVDLVREVRDKGLQGVVLTDHHYVWPSDELEALRKKAKLEPWFVLLSGQEVTTDRGDVLVFGPEEPLEKGTRVEELAGRYAEAALVWAHAYRKGARPDAEVLRVPEPFHGIEIFSSNHTVRDNIRGLRDWHQHKFTALAGTDTHARGYAGTYPTQFDHGVGTMEELLGEIRAGRCRPFFKEIPRTGANLQVTEVVVGTKGRSESRERWIIRNVPAPSRWEKARRTYGILDAVFRHGFDRGPYRVPEPLDLDEPTHTIVEAGQRGKSLYDKLLAVSAREGVLLMEMVASWLARYHDTGLRLSPAEDFLRSEERRVRGYVKRFHGCGHPHTKRAEALAEIVLEAERRIVDGGVEGFVQGHGDFHPKNVLIGQDQADDRSSMFVSAIDFESSQLCPRAYDVGTFLAQFDNQLHEAPEVLARYPGRLFLESYHRRAASVPVDFLRQVELFRARTNLSIAAYLIKVGMGDSADLWRVLVEAERAVALYCS